MTGAREDVRAAATICATCALLGAAAAAAPPAAAAAAACAAPAAVAPAPASAGCWLPAAGAVAPAGMPVPRPVSTVLVRRPANCSTSAGLLKSGRAWVRGRPAAFLSPPMPSGSWGYRVGNAGVSRAPDPSAGCSTAAVLAVSSGLLPCSSTLLADAARASSTSSAAADCSWPLTAVRACEASAVFTPCCCARAASCCAP